MVSGKVRGQGSVPKLALGTSVQEVAPPECVRVPLGVGKFLPSSPDCVSYPFVCIPVAS